LSSSPRMGALRGVVLGRSFGSSRGPMGRIGLRGSVSGPASMAEPQKPNAEDDRWHGRDHGQKDGREGATTWDCWGPRGFRDGAVPDFAAVHKLCAETKRAGPGPKCSAVEYDRSAVGLHNPTSMG
jgi:hypothetical protein